MLAHATTVAPSTKRHWVVYQDTNGCRRFVGGAYDFETWDEAEARIAELLAGQKKEHKITYEVLTYLPGGKATAMREYNIAG